MDDNDDVDSDEYLPESSDEEVHFETVTESSGNFGKKIDFD